MTDGLPDQNETKTCTKCKETKPVTEFYVLRPRKYGGYSYRPSCKQCDSKGAMAWSENNRDKVNSRRRERYHNSERAQRAKSARQEALRQKRLEMARWPFTERTCRKCGETKPIEEFAKGDGGDLRRVCKECKAEQHRQWRAKNPEHVKEWHREYGQTPERKAVPIGNGTITTRTRKVGERGPYAKNIGSRWMNMTPCWRGRTGCVRSAAMSASQAGLWRWTMITLPARCAAYCA